MLATAAATKSQKTSDRATFPIVAKLGGLRAIYDRLRDRGAAPKTLMALRMWDVRGQIPGDHVVTLMRICEDEGIEYSAGDFELPKQDVAEPTGDAA